MSKKFLKVIAIAIIINLTFIVSQSPSHAMDNDDDSTCYCGARLYKKPYRGLNPYSTHHYDENKPDMVETYRSVGPRCCVGPSCEYRVKSNDSESWYYCSDDAGLCLNCHAPIPGPSRYGHPMREQYEEVNFFAYFLPCNCRLACLKLVPSFVWHTFYDVSCLLTNCLCNPPRCEPADKNLYEGIKEIKEI